MKNNKLQLVILKNLARKNNPKGFIYINFGLKDKQLELLQYKLNKYFDKLFFCLTYIILLYQVGKNN